MGRAKARKTVRAKPKPVKTEADRVVDKAREIGVPEAQIARGEHAIIDMPLRDGGRVVTLKTLVNRGGRPVTRWTAAGLLSDSQLAAIAHCERLWAMLGGKSLVANLERVPGGSGNGWAEQEALDDLARIKDYVPAKWWSVFEDVCRFDEPAGFAGSKLAEDRSDPEIAERDRAVAARLTVQFVADVIAMKERLAHA